MKKKLFLICTLAAVLCFAAVFAEKMPENIELQDIGFNDMDKGKNSVYIARKGEGEEYLVDAERNIIGGPYEYISDFETFPYAVQKSGAKTLYDHNGEVLADVQPGWEIDPPANGVYAVRNNEDSTLVTEFILYEYPSKKELCRFDFYVDLRKAQQAEKWFVQKGGKWALVNKQGEFLTDFIYDDVIKQFNPDYFPYPKAYAIVKQNGEEKYIDWNLNEIDLDDYNGEPFVTNCTYLSASGYDYKRYYIYENKDKTAIYDKTEEKYLIPYQNEYKFVYKNGKYIIAKKGSYFGIIDEEQNVILPFEYSGLSFDNDSGFLVYSKGAVDLAFSGYYDLERQCIASEDSGFLHADGIFIKGYTNYDEEGYKHYCAEILNAAGHNLTGEVYHPSVNYSDGRFYKISGYEGEEPQEIDVKRNFAVIKLNGKYLDFDGVIKKSRTLVPVREIIENLGGEVNWNNGEKTVKTVLKGKTIGMQIGSDKLTVNGEERVLDTPAQLIGDKTMIPLRALAEAAGFKVDWDNRIKCVYIVAEK